jgi:ribosomal protein L29
MVSPYIAGALQGLEKGLAAQELKKQKDMTNFLAIKKLEADSAKNKLASYYKQLQINEKAKKELAINDLKDTKFKSVYSSLRQDPDNKNISDIVLRKIANSEANSFINMVRISPRPVVQNLMKQSALRNKRINEVIAFKKIGIPEDQAKNLVTKQWKLQTLQDGRVYLVNTSSYPPKIIDAQQTASIIKDPNLLKKIMASGEPQIRSSLYPRDFLNQNIPKPFRPLNLIKEDKQGNLSITPEGENPELSAKRREQLDNTLPFATAGKGKPTLYYSPKDRGRFSQSDINAMGTTQYLDSLMNTARAYGNYPRINYKTSYMPEDKSASATIDSMVYSTRGAVQQFLTNTRLGGLLGKRISAAGYAYRRELQNVKTRVMALLAHQKLSTRLKMIVDRYSQIFPAKGGLFMPLEKIQGEFIAMIKDLNLELFKVNQKLGSGYLKNKSEFDEFKRDLESVLQRIGNPYRIRTTNQFTKGEILRGLQDLPGLSAKQKQSISKVIERLKATKELGQKLESNFEMMGPPANANKKGGSWWKR